MNRTTMASITPFLIAFSLVVASIFAGLSIELRMLFGFSLLTATEIAFPSAIMLLLALLIILKTGEWASPHINEYLFWIPLGLILMSACLLNSLLIVIPERDWTLKLPIPHVILILSASFLILLAIFLWALSLLSQSQGFSSIRYFLLWISRGIGQIYQYLSGGWRPPLVRLANIAIVVYMAELILILSLIFSPSIMSLLDQMIGAQNRHILTTSFNGGLPSVMVTFWIQWRSILVVWILYEIFRFMWRASHQLIIKVEDYTEPKQGNTEITKQKFADLLQVKLNRIGDIYREVDEQRAIRSAGGAGKPIDVGISTEDTSELLKGALSGSDISLGPLKIPFGSIASIIGRLMQGPCIIVGLHSAESCEGYALTASLTGYKEPYSWLVDSQEPLVRPDNLGSKEPSKVKSEKIESVEIPRSIEDMMTELAHRIFAKLTFDKDDRPVPWRAVWNFSEGLRAYRDCLHTVKKQKYYLKVAERRFIETLEEYDKFDLAYYNLGVVYTELKQLEAAEVAFSKAIELPPNRLEEYYAFGYGLFKRARKEEDLCQIEGETAPVDQDQEITKQYEQIKVLCDYIVKIEHEDFANLAKAYDLRGNVNNRLAQININDRSHKENIEHYSKVSINDCKAAIKYAWSALYEAEILGENIEDRRNIVSECLIDLAYFHRKRYKQDTLDTYGSLKLAEDALRQAERVDPYDPNIHSEFGKVYCIWKQDKDHYKKSHYKKAINAFEFAVQIAPENSLFWAYLALARSLDYASCHSNKYADKSINRDVYRNIISWSCENAFGYSSESHFKALEHAAEAYKKIEEIEQGLRLERAAFLENLKGISREGARGLICLEKVLKRYDDQLCQVEGKRSGLEEDAEWKYAQLVLSLVRLRKILDKREYVKCSKKDTDDKYIQRAIEIINCKISLKEIEEEVPEILHKLDRCNKIKELYDQYLYEVKGKYDLRDWQKAQELHVLGQLYIEDAKERDNAKDEGAIKEWNKAKLCFGLAHNILRIKSQDITETKRDIYVQEYVLLHIDLGRMYLHLGRSKRMAKEAKDCYKESENCFSEAITVLERNYPQELKHSRVKGVKAQLANALLSQGKKYCALKQAQAARTLNPINYCERKNAGEIFCALKEYEYAIEELGNALSWKPDDPDILVELGLAHLRKARTYLSGNERYKDLKKSREYLDQAIKQLDKDDLKRRAYVRYWTGIVCLELDEWMKEAIPHFRVLHEAININVPGMEKRGEIWIIALQLGHAYLKNKAYEMSKEAFEYIIKNCKSESKTNDIISNEMDDKLTLGEIIAWAHLGISFSYAERGVCLDKAMDYTNKAEGLIKDLQPENEDPMAEEIEKRKLKIEAALEDCRGWIYFKQNRLDDSIYHLERSISRTVKSLYYLHLAMAIERKLQISSLDKSEMLSLLIKARDYCRHAAYADLKGEYSDQIDEVKKRIEAMSAERLPNSEEKLTNSTVPKGEN